MNHFSFPPWSSANLEAICQAYDAVVRPRLGALALISSAASGIGLFSQFDNPTIVEYVLCLGIAFALWLMASVMWTGAWHLPELETRRPLLIYAFVAVLGFVSYAAVSVTANLSATTGKVSLELVQKGNINALENVGQKAAAYVDEMRVVQAGLVGQSTLARRSERAEIAGEGPTGVPGSGPVSRSFGASAAKYDQAATLLQRVLTQAEARLAAMGDAILELRTAQIAPDLTVAEKEARLKALSGQAIGEMRALLALDPARAVRTAASSVAAGVPTQSGANPQSQARIAEITADMKAYARQMETEADRIASLAPGLPEQSTLSTAERLFETMWRTPAWTAVAWLLDFLGWLAVGWRTALYQALKSKIAEETDRPVPNFVSLEDFWRVEEFVARAEEAKKRIEAAKGVRKRGRPRTRGLPKPTGAPKKPRKPKGSRDQSDD